MGDFLFRKYLELFHFEKKNLLDTFEFAFPFTSYLIDGKGSFSLPIVMEKGRKQIKSNYREIKENNMGSKLKHEMWENTMNFLKEIDCESVADVCWNYDDDGAITKIEIVFETPMYLTSAPSEKPQESK